MIKYRRAIYTHKHEHVQCSYTSVATALIISFSFIPILFILKLFERVFVCALDARGLEYSISFVFGGRLSPFIVHIWFAKYMRIQCKYKHPLPLTQNEQQQKKKWELVSDIGQ